jgi:hypothetical protein
MNSRILLVLVALGVLIPVLSGVFHLSLMLIRIVGAVVVIGCILYIILHQSVRKRK